MIYKGCEKICMCATCVYNPHYAVNTPKPCIGADCDICRGEAECSFCSGYLNLEELNKRVKEVENME